MRVAEEVGGLIFVVDLYLVEVVLSFLAHYLLIYLEVGVEHHFS